MKVVLFCGGQGMRLREYSEKVPKPMIPIGYRPILWYVMKYYAHYGHKDFILCLGYQGDVIKNYFVNYCEYTSNDFVYSKGGSMVNLINKDIEDWTITFADTGINSLPGERLLAVKKYLKDDEHFLVNYSDALTDLPLDTMVNEYFRKGKKAMMMVTQPTRSFHVVVLDSREQEAIDITTLSNSGLWINAGYFIFHRSVLDCLKPGEDLVDHCLPRLVRSEQLSVFRFNGTWIPMDTFKEKQMIDDMYQRGDTPWEVWKKEVHDVKHTA